MTTTWKIDSVMSHDEMFGKQDVVFAINFRVIGDSTIINGTTGVAYSETDEYTPLADLTEDILLSWVQAALSEESRMEYEQRASDKIPNITTKCV